MEDSDTLIKRAVTILVYRNPGSAHRYLTDVFGFTPGELALGADSISEPRDQPYGYREYSARDCEGVVWSFMKEIRP